MAKHALVWKPLLEDPSEHIGLLQIPAIFSANYEPQLQQFMVTLAGTEFQITTSISRILAKMEELRFGEPTRAFAVDPETMPRLYAMLKTGEERRAEKASFDLAFRKNSNMVMDRLQAQEIEIAELQKSLTEIQEAFNEAVADARRTAALEDDLILGQFAAATRGWIRMP